MQKQDSMRRANFLSPQGCPFSWCRGITSTSTSSRRDGKTVVLPLQQSWAVNAVTPEETLTHVPIDVHLYIRGGSWVEMFANKLVGEAGGQTLHPSAIYVSGQLRIQGEDEYRSRLEAKGLTLPEGWQCDEWILYQRQGERIIIKLAYSRPSILDGIAVYLETDLTDEDVWWSLPVWVDTDNEPVFGKMIHSGVFSPAIKDREITVGIANRGSENVAVMPSIDGQNLLKAPILLWGGNTRKRNWSQGGSTFCTIPGLQVSLTTNKKERTEVLYKRIRFMNTALVQERGLANPLLREQGMLKVKIFRAKKIIFRSDPDRKLEQIDGMRKEMAASVVPKTLQPLQLVDESQESKHFDVHVGSSEEEIKVNLSPMDVSFESQNQIDEMSIRYRSLNWFRAAASAKQSALETKANKVTNTSSKTENNPDSIKQDPSQEKKDDLPSLQESPANFSNHSVHNISEPVVDSVSPQPNQTQTSSSTKSQNWANRSSSPDPIRGRVRTHSQTSFSNNVKDQNPRTVYRSASPSTRTGTPTSSRGLVQTSSRRQSPQTFSRSSRTSLTSKTTEGFAKVSPSGRGEERDARNGSSIASKTFSRSSSPQTPVRARRLSMNENFTSKREEKTPSNRRQKNVTQVPAEPKPSFSVWVQPRILGSSEDLQKDEIFLTGAVKNVANLKRQAKLDFAPLFDSWSTAVLAVKMRDVVLAPETVLEDLSEDFGSPSNPVILETSEPSVRNSSGSNP